MMDDKNKINEKVDPIIERFVGSKEWIPLLAYIKEGGKKIEEMSVYTLRAYWKALKGLSANTPEQMKQRVKIARLLYEKDVGKEKYEEKIKDKSSNDEEKIIIKTRLVEKRLWYLHDLFELDVDMTDEEIKNLISLYVKEEMPDELELFAEDLIEKGKYRLIDIKLLENLIKSKKKMAPLTICRNIIQKVDDEEMQWEALQVYRKYTASTEKARETVIEFYKKKFGHLKHFEYFLEKAEIHKVGVTEGGNRFEKYINYEEGKYLRDNKIKVWKVKSIDEQVDMITVEPIEGTTRSLEFLEAVKIYSPLQDDDFRVYATHRKEDLLKFSPVEIVEILLKSYNRVMKSHEIATFLKPVIGMKEWGSFWRTFKKEVEEKGHIEILTGSSRQPTYRYNPTIVKKSEDTKSDLSLVDLINKIKKKKDSNKLLKQWKKSSNKEIILQIGLALLGEKIEIKELDKETMDFLIDVIKETDFVPLLSLIYKYLSDDVLIDLLLNTGDNIRNFMYKKELHDVIYKGMKKAFIKKMRYPRAFFWSARMIIEKKMEPLEDMTRASVLSALLSFINTDMKKSSNVMDARNIKTRIKQYLLNNHYAIIFDVLADSTPGIRKLIKNNIESNRAISIHKRKDIVGFIEREFDDEQEEKTEEEYLFSSPWSIDRMKERFRKLRTEEIPKNSEEISKAAAHGDLSENAEYKYARQKQERLISEVTSIEEMLGKMRPFPPHKEDEVTIGSRIIIENEKGKKEELIIGGIWDVDVDEGIISYKSPIGRSFIGKHKGDEITMPDGSKMIIKEVYPWTEE